MIKTYEVQYNRNCLSDLEKVPKQMKQNIRKKIEALSSNPRPNGCKKLQGSQKIALYRIRCGDYRIVYSINDDVLLILIVEIGLRKEVYRSLR